MFIIYYNISQIYYEKSKYRMKWEGDSMTKITEKVKGNTNRK